jgi:electron transport complex protein RnfE
MFASLARFKKGILDENPVFVQALALCPVLAITTSLENGIGMGFATLFVLLASCFAASLLRNVIPEQVRIPCFIVLSATFTTVVSMIMEVFFPALHGALGIFIPLIVINCIILARMETFASKSSPFATVFDALGMGLGFTLALAILGFVREITGFGTVFGHNVLPDAFPGFMLMAVPAGGFLAFGFIVAGLTALRRKARQRKGA